MASVLSTFEDEGRRVPRVLVEEGKSDRSFVFFASADLNRVAPIFGAPDRGDAESVEDEFG